MQVLTSDRDPRICTVAHLLLRFEPELAVVGKARDDSRTFTQSIYHRPAPILLDLNALRKNLVSTRLCPSMGGE